MEDAVRKELKRLEDDGILKSLAYAEWTSPIVIVPKADGLVRICGDYKRQLTRFLETEQYPMPNADELFQKMQGGKMFTKLDLKSAYLQMELHEASRKFLVINTPDGLKENIRMPNGIKPASAIFQKKLEGEVKHVPLPVVNIDDILISGTDTPNHVSNVLAVLDRLTELGVTLNLDKCKFFQKRSRIRRVYFR